MGNDVQLMGNVATPMGKLVKTNGKRCNTNGNHYENACVRACVRACDSPRSLDKLRHIRENQIVIRETENTGNS